MQSFFAIGPSVPEKIFEGFLPYMGMAAILVMWPELFIYTLIPLPTDDSYKIWLWWGKQFQSRCLTIMVIYMYIVPGWGHMSPWGHFF